MPSKSELKNRNKGQLPASLKWRFDNDPPFSGRLTLLYAPNLLLLFEISMKSTVLQSPPCSLSCQRGRPAANPVLLPFTFTSITRFQRFILFILEHIRSCAYKIAYDILHTFCLQMVGFWLCLPPKKRPYSATTWTWSCQDTTTSVTRWNLGFWRWEIHQNLWNWTP